jgi:hypothetical protein
MYRIPDIPSRVGGAQPPPAQPRPATMPAAARASPRQLARSAESARLGIRCHGRPMQPATLRVLETTWRVWREPLA